MRLGKAAAPLPALAKLAVALCSRNLGHHGLKRKVWGGREEDDELTNTKKKGAGSPASSNDGRQ
jgi:hypothetical protein